MKKIVSLALCMLLLVVLCFALASCQCKHEYGAEVRIEPTCTEDGKYMATCTKCGEVIEYAPDTDEDDMLATGHTKNAGTVTTEPTCTEAGVKEIKCAVCDKKIEDEVIAALGHTYEEDEYETDEANHWNECSVCEAKVNTTACTFVLTALDNEKHGQTCSVCENVKANSEEKHTLGTATVITAATCSKEGKQTQTCSVCESDIESIIPIVPHTWGTAYTGDDTNHWYACTVCNAADPDRTGAHTLGEEQTYTPEATSCENGKKYKVCSVCSGEVVTDVIPSATPHAVITTTVENGNVSYACNACHLSWTSSVAIVFDGSTLDGWNAATDNKIFQTASGSDMPEIVDNSYYQYIEGPGATKNQYQTWYQFSPVNPGTATGAFFSVKLKAPAGGLATGIDSINLTEGQPTNRYNAFSLKLVEEFNGWPNRWEKEWCYTANMVRIDKDGNIYGWITETVVVDGEETTVDKALGTLKDNDWTTISFSIAFDSSDEQNPMVIATYYIDGNYVGTGTMANTTLNHGFESLYQNGYSDVAGTGMCMDDLIIAWKSIN